MYKYLISIFLVLNSFLIADYEDKSPQKTTHEDLEILQNFKKLVYDKTKSSEILCNQEAIIDYIYSNKSEIFDYNKVLVNLVGQVNSTNGILDSDGIYKDRDRASIGLVATYPIFDERTDLEIKKCFQDKIDNEINSISYLRAIQEEFGIDIWNMIPELK